MQSDIVRWSVKIFGADFISHNIYSHSDVLVVLRRDLFTTDLFRTQNPISDPFGDGAPGTPRFQITMTPAFFIFMHANSAKGSLTKGINTVFIPLR